MVFLITMIFTCEFYAQNKSDYFSFYELKSSSVSKERVRAFLKEKTKNDLCIITDDLFQEWDGGWINDFSDTLFYDAGWNNIRRLELIWENNSWVNNTNHLYEFDSLNRKILYFFKTTPTRLIRLRISNFELRILDW
jgi:hypothetical protein